MSTSANTSTDDPAPPQTAPPVGTNTNRQSSPQKEQAAKRRITDLRFHAAIAASVAVAAFAFSQIGPSFRTVVNFFWPLFLSTGVFLVAVTVLRIFSPLATAGDAADKAGSDLMDFVAGGSAGGQEERQDAETAEEVKDHNENKEQEEEHRDPR